MGVGFDWGDYWLTIVPADVSGVMRQYRVTIRELAGAMGLPMTRVRALRSMARMTRNDWRSVNDACADVWLRRGRPGPA